MVDAVIVGAGHNGLVAATYLARAGLDVEVVERREIVGGCCVTEELWPGVRASPGAYTLSLLRAGDHATSWAWDGTGSRSHAHEPYLFAPQPDGRKVVTWSSRERTVAQLERDWCAADAGGYSEWSQRWEAAAARARPLDARAGRPRALAGRGRPGDPRRARSPTTSAGIPSEAVRVPFAIQGLIGTLAGPEDPGTAFVGLLPRPRRGRRRAGRLGLRARRDGRGDGRAARRRPEAAGARCDSSARRARPRRRRFAAPPTACCCEGGEEIRARAVLSNADPGRARPALAGLRRPPGWATDGPGREGDAAARRPARLPLVARARSHGRARSTSGSRWATSRPRRRPTRGPAGRPRSPWIEAACQTAADPTLAPAGRHVLSMFCQCFPTDVDADDAADARDRPLRRDLPGLPGPDRRPPRRWGRASSKSVSGSPAGTSSTARCSPGSCSSDRFGPRAFGGVEGLYLVWLGRASRRRGDRCARLPRRAGGAGGPGGLSVCLRPRPRGVGSPGTQADAHRRQKERA